MATRIGTAFVDVKGDFTQLNQGVAAALAPAKLGKFGKVAGVAAGAAFAGGIAAAGIGKLAYDLGAEFDKAFDKIRVGTGKTGKPLKQLERDFKAVFSSVPTDAENAATAIAGLSTRLDLTGKPLRRMSKNMLELSRMTETDLGGNIQSVTRLFGDWGVQTEKQIPTLNKLWRAHQKTGVGIKDLSDLMVQFGSPLRNLGFDFDTAAAMFSKFEKEGVNVQTAMPGLRMALKNFAKDGKDPQKALMATFEAIDKAGSTAKANTIAFDTFGTRAGPDLAAAVREGRFEFDDIIKSMRDGKSTIMDTSNDTRDFGENMNKFGNKLKVIFEPLGTLVYNSVGKLSAALADLPLKKYASEIQKFTKHNQDFKDVLKAVRVGLKAFGEVAKVAFSIMKEQFKAAWTYVKGAMRVMRGVIKITSGVLTGDWSKAWAGVKDIFRGSVKVVLGVLRGMTAPVRKLASLVGGVLGKVFSGAWDRVEGIFETGANAVISVVNKIIDAINAIPGLDDIDHVGTIGSSGPKTPAQKKFNTFQRGSLITGGKPSGDSVPALLERGEYVLNREAVKKVGVQNLDHLNFKKAARFQTGGPIGMIGGGIMDAAKGALSGAANLAMKGPNFFIDKLPKPNIPEPFTGVGPYVIDAAVKYIKDKVDPFGGGSIKGGGDIVAVGKMLQKMGYEVSEHPAFGGVDPVHSAGSFHYSARAIDVNDDISPRGGSEAASLDWLYPQLAKMPHAELLWRVADHYDHLHFAMQRGGLAGRLRRMVKGGAVVKQAAPLLARKGFDFKAIAGILGNAWRESMGWNTEQMELTGLDNGGLFGFTTSPVSMPDLRNYAASKGKSWADVDTQINFMLSHGQPTGMALRGALNAKDSIPDTTELFMDEWERPGVPALSERIKGGFMAARIMKDLPLGGGVEGKAFGGSGKAGFGYAIGDPNPAAVERSHKKTLGKIKTKGLAYAFKGKLSGIGGKLEMLGERLGIAEQNASAEWGPGGSEMTEAEKAEQIGLNQEILDSQKKEDSWLIKSIAGLYAKETAMTDAMWAAKPKDSKTHWKFAALKKAVKDIRGNITTLTGNRVTLTGLTGQGGEIFDTQMRLKDLGVASTVESASAAARDSELISLMREQLGLANRNNAILSAQLPIYQQFMPKFHDGGVYNSPVGQTEGPALLRDGELVLTPEQQAAGGNTINLWVNGVKADPSQVRMEVERNTAGLARKTRTGNYGPKFSTAGLR